MINLRTVPSVAVKIDLIDLLRTIKSFKNNILNIFKDNLKSYFNFRECILFPKARLGLRDLLTVLSEKTSKNEVIIPDYTCSTVLFSVLYSGLKPVIVDIELDDFNISVEKIAEKINEKTLAVIAVDMYGKRSNINAIRNITKEKGIYIIEDAAQSAGKYIVNNGKADFLLISFGKAKNFSAIEGGAVLGNDSEIMNSLNLKLHNYNNPNIKRILFLLMKLFLYPIAVNPYIYSIVKNFPHKEIIKDIVNSYSGSNLSIVQSALGNVLLSRLDQLNDKRIKNANEILYLIKESNSYIIPDSKNNVYLRFAFACKEKNVSNILIKKLNLLGISVPAVSFPVLSSLYNKKNIDIYSNSNFVSSNIITLPTHSYLRNGDIDKIKFVLCDYKQQISHI